MLLNYSFRDFVKNLPTCNRSYDECNFPIKGTMVNKLILFLMITLTLSGCATTRWEHPMKSQASNHLDWLHCMQTATLYANETGYSHDKVFIMDEAEKCMIEKYGWVKKKDYSIRYYLPIPFNLFLI